MTRLTPAPLGSPAHDRIARSWRVRRLAVGFLLDIIGIARGEGHVLDKLLVAAIIQANVQDIIRRPDLQAAFAQSDELPTDDMRRPVSMNAIASSLQLPFETVRRRVTGMVRDGYCRFVDGGVIVPSAVLAAPQYYVDGFRVFERFRSFYYQMSDLGLLRDLPPPSIELSPDVFPMRAVARLSGAYLLRVIEAFGAVGELLDGLILLQIFRANGEDLPLGAADPEESADPEDAARLKPIPVAALARGVGVPLETVRRHVAALVARGDCVRQPGGLVVPADALAAPLLRGVLDANVKNLQRLFVALSQLGVLQVWDSVRPPPE